MNPASVARSVEHGPRRRASETVNVVCAIHHNVSACPKILILKIDFLLVPFCHFNVFPVLLFFLTAKRLMKDFQRKRLGLGKARRVKSKGFKVLILFCDGNALLRADSAGS